MILTPILRSLLMTAAMVCLPLIAGAATLQVKVVEVESGNTLVVTSINRPLKIKLQGVAPPESGQPFSDSAREHLKSLVFEKIVTVEYTTLAEGYLSARMSSDGIDIGSEMIRHGLAWYDRDGDHGLRDTDRVLYAQCEQTARVEKQGLWRDPFPISPWEFRQNQLDRVNGMLSEPSFRQAQANKQRAARSFTNDNLLGAMSGDATAGGVTFKRIAANGRPGTWTKYESVTEHFSVLFPSTGVEATIPSFDTAGNETPIRYLAGTNEGEMYALMAAKGPSEKDTDASVSDKVARTFVDGLTHGFGERGLHITLAIKPQRNLKLSGYAGKQYALRGEDMSGFIRVYSKQIGDQREFYMLCVLTRTGFDSNGAQFLNSFRIQ